MIPLSSSDILCVNNSKSYIKYITFLLIVLGVAFSYLVQILQFGDLPEVSNFYSESPIVLYYDRLKDFARGLGV